MNNVFIIIPALDPSFSLCRYVEKLKSIVSAFIVVIDDGSKASSSRVFNFLSEKQNCTVLHHGVNRGKGRALKTGFCYVKNHFEGDCRIVTVDSDGQHKAEDVERILKKLGENPGTLVLGERNFSVKGVPFRSRFGNSSISFMFWMTCGKWIRDTQTGLRAFDKSLLNSMIEVRGERFDYEMQVLVFCAKKGIDISTIDIATIYENGNQSSHFRPVADSISILKTLIGDISGFALSSLFCAGLDILLFWILAEAVPAGMFYNDFHRIWTATLGARIVSSGANYLINRCVVFKSSGRFLSLMRYIVLCMSVSAASAVFVTLFSKILPFSPTFIKVICDTGLFFLSYYFQKFWVFRKGDDKNDF